MKIFESKSIFKKLLIVLLSIIVLSFCTPKTVKAVGDDDVGVGGKILDPVMSMFVGLSDGAITLLQKIVLHVDESMIEVDTTAKGISKILGIVVAVTVVVVGAVAVVASGGTALSIAGGVLTVVKGGVIAGVATFCISSAITNAVLPEDFVLPQIKLSPYEIFANQIPVFDVDFFNPSESTYVDNRKMYVIQQETPASQKSHNYIKEQFKNDYGYTSDSVVSEQRTESGIFGLNKHTVYTDTWKYEGKTYVFEYKDSGSWRCVRYNSKGEEEAFLQLDTSGGADEHGWIVELKWNTNISSGEDQIFTDPINVSSKTEAGLKSEGEVEEIKSTASELQGTISKWYIILRNLSLVALLSVLVYVGIRIIISSTSKDKAKYKQMLIDWIVAICLLFVMHYIMSFSNLLEKKLIDIIDATDVIENAEDLPDGVLEGKEISEEGVVSEKKPQAIIISQEKQVSKAYDILVTDRAKTQGVDASETEFYGYFVINEETGKPEVLNWPTNNFTEQARMMLQFVDAADEAGDSSNTYAYATIGYKIIYCVLVIYTIIFVFTYLKRTIFMAFLTLIAPLVALTYPIDKMNDGQAQAFNKWFKEYIFNLLIQPLHLILYMVLIGSAMDFASQNIIYVVVALGFMTQGEKLLRSFFGFEKAHTPGFLAGPAGAAVIMNGVNKLLGRPPHKGGKGSKEIGGSESKDDNKINYNDSLDTSSLFSAEEGNHELDVPNTLDNDATVGNLETTDDFTNNRRTDNQGRVNQPTNNRRGNGTETENQLPIFRDRGGFDFTPPNNTQQENDFYNGNYMRRLGGNINQRQNRNNTRSTPTFQKRAIKGLKNVGSKIRMKADNEHTLRKLAGVGTGLLGAGVAATAAGVIGITSGDPSKAAQYMSAAALGGYKFADGIPEGLSNLNSTRKDYTEAFREGYYTDDEIRERQIKKKIKEAEDDKKLLKELEKRLGSEETAQHAMDTVVPGCIRYGLEDANEIAAVYERERSGATAGEALMQVKYVKEYGKDTSKLGHKDSEDLNATIMDRVRKNSRQGATAEEMNAHARKLRENFDNTSKILFKKL